MSLPWTGVALALAGAIGFSGKAIIAKLAYRYGVDAITLVAWRMALALPLFLALAWWAGRGKDPLTARDWRLIGVLGFTGYYLASTLDFAGLQYISASLERLILYLNPTLVMLLGWLIYRRRITSRQAAAAAVSYAGVALVFGHELRLEGANAVLGAGLVLGSAISYAFYLILSGEELRRLGTLRLTGLASSVACVLCLLQFVVVHPLPVFWQVAPEVVWLSVLNAVLCTFAPVLMVMMAIERLGAATAAQVGMVGPMSTLVLAYFLLDEPLNVWIGAGTALVLLGVAMVARVRG